MSRSSFILPVVSAAQIPNGTVNSDTPLNFRSPQMKVDFIMRCARLKIDQAEILRAALEYAMKQSDATWIAAAHGTPFPINTKKHTKKL